MADTQERPPAGAALNLISRLLRRIKPSKGARHEQPPHDRAPAPTSSPRTSMLKGLPRVVMDPNAGQALSDALAAALAGDPNKLHRLCAEVNAAPKAQTAASIKTNEAYHPDQDTIDATVGVLAGALRQIEGPADLGDVAGLIETLAKLVRLSSPAVRKDFDNALDSVFSAFEKGLLPDTATCATLGELLMVTKHSKCEPAYTLARALVAQGEEANAIILVSKMLKLAPTRGNCFNLLMKMKDTPRRNSIVDEHLKRMPP